MIDRIERELWLEATPEAVWDAVTRDGWLADRVRLDLRPGGDAEFESDGRVRTGWVEDVAAPERLSFWWALDDEPASRVELKIQARGTDTRLYIVETRPLDRLDLVGVPLPGVGGASYGPALVAA
jgi:uncharacterized protein YndB with AHSA1/START domain